jgi:hypothetical protein
VTEGLDLCPNGHHQPVDLGGWQMITLGREDQQGTVHRAQHAADVVVSVLVGETCSGKGVLGCRSEREPSGVIWLGAADGRLVSFTE